MEEQESGVVDVVHISIEDSSSCVEPDAETVATMLKEHREMMHKFAEAQGDSPKSLVMSLAKHESIIHHLQHPEVKVDPHFKYWVKSRQFQLLDLPDEVESQVLVIPKYKTRKYGYKPSFLRVVHAGQLADLVYRVHAEELQHSGYKRVLEKVQKQYFGVTRVFIQEFCKTCPVCLLKPHQSAPATSSGQAPEPRETRERCGTFQDTAHIDIIDMRQTPDGEYRYIGHFLDDYSQYHILFPMKRKTPPELARLLEERVLGYFGPPKVVHVSEDTEINRLVSETFDKWGSDVTIDKNSGASRSARMMERFRQVILDRLLDIQVYEGTSYASTSTVNTAKSTGDESTKKSGSSTNVIPSKGTSKTPCSSTSKSKNSTSNAGSKGTNRTTNNITSKTSKGSNNSANNASYPWASWLPRIMFTLNSECQKSVKDSPYFNVYGCSSPILLYSEERCQGGEEPIEEEEFEGFQGSSWGTEVKSSIKSMTRGVSRSQGVTRPSKTLIKDHNYITVASASTTSAIKKIKTEVPDSDEEG